MCEKEKSVVGVTGSLATGKTTVSDMFALLGAEIINADRIAHKILKDEDFVKKNVLELFGPEVEVKGEISRESLAGVVFSDKKKLADLNAVLHPPIIRAIKERINLSRSEVIVLDAPLLFETGLEKMTTFTITVRTEQQNQLKRAIGKGLDPLLARRIIAAQYPLEKKMSMADFVIDNNGELEETRKQVEEIWLKKLQNRPEGKKS